MTTIEKLGPCDKCGQQAAQPDECLCPSCKAKGSGEGESLRDLDLSPAFARGGA